MTIKKICKQCKKEFEAFVHKNRKYCCRRCYEKAKIQLALIEMKCDFCGKLFIRKKCEMKKRKMKFCNPTCAQRFISLQKRNLKTRPENYIYVIDEKIKIECPECKKERIVGVRGRELVKSNLCWLCSRSEKERRIKSRISMLELWENGNIYEKSLGTRLFKNQELNKLDKKLIKAYFLLFKIRRSING